MTSRRVLKVAEAIREVVSMAILAELKDPRVRNVTVTGVEVSGDLKQAKILVSIMGSETQQSLTLRGLQSAAGFLQAKVAERLDLRYTPKIEFSLDLGVKKSLEVARILREALPPISTEEPADLEADADEPEGADGGEDDEVEDDEAEDGARTDEEPG